MEVIIDIQGFKMEPNEFVLKELFISSVRVNKCGEEIHKLFTFDPPFPWKNLPRKYKKTNNWLTANHHGLCWESRGTHKYTSIVKILKKVLKGVDQIYVKGLEKKKWLETMLKNKIPVDNLEDFDCPNFESLKEDECINHRALRKEPIYHCAQSNVMQLKMWYNQYTKECMEKSLKKFCTLQNLNQMTTEEIAHLPTYFLMAFAGDAITMAWDKLPKFMQEDPQIARYQRCTLHWNSSAGDQVDGPTPSKINCPFCKFFD